MLALVDINADRFNEWRVFKEGVLKTDCKKAGDLPATNPENSPERYKNSLTL